jgi:hypothetical protein
MRNSKDAYFGHLVSTRSPSQSDQARKRNKMHSNWKEVKLYTSKTIFYIYKIMKESTKELLE